MDAGEAHIGRRVSVSVATPCVGRRGGVSVSDPPMDELGDLSGGFKGSLLSEMS